MTTTMHASLYRFTIPETPEFEYSVNGVPRKVKTNPLVLLDVADIANSRSDGSIEVDDEKRRMTGHGKFNPSFGVGTFDAYFCADFKGAAPKHSGTFTGDVAAGDQKEIEKIPTSWANPGGSAGGFFHFIHPSRAQIMARVGLSFISAEQACSNAESEIPDFNFDRVVKSAQAAWTDKLSAVEVDASGVSEELQMTFWSGLYRSFLLPENYTGENQLWESKEPYFDSFYCIWDSYRAQHPLLTIIDPKAQAEMVRALLDIYRNLGHLPDCRMSFCKGYTQVRRLPFYRRGRRGANRLGRFERGCCDCGCFHQEHHRWH